MLRRNRLAGAAALAAAGTLFLGACGSNNNSSSSPSSSSGSGSSSGGSTAAAGINCASGSLMASGSTAQANAMSEWIKNFQQQCSGANVNYGGGGSGQGISQFTAGTVDFAGSDAPLNSTEKPEADKRCGTGNQAVDLPMVPGPIAVGYNLPGVSSLKLSAANLAKIFSGKITKWDDPAIKADNPGTNLPSIGIQTFHRSDGSGTSYSFSMYLDGAAKADWSYGFNKNWPAPGGQGAKGTAGVAQGVKQTQGGIGYMEQSYADNSSIPYAEVGDGQGNFIKLTQDNVTAFLSHAKVAGSNGDMPLKFDYQSGDKNAYPSVLVTYEIVCKSGNKSDKLPLLKGFLGYLVSDSGQSILPNTGYVKLPSNLQSQVASEISGLS